MAKTKATTEKCEILKEEERFKFCTAEELDKMLMVRIKSRKWDPLGLKLRRMMFCDYIRQGLSYTRIIEEVMARLPVSSTTCERWMKDATDQLKNDCDTFIQSVREAQIERIQGIAETAYQNGDTANALKAYEMLNKMFGLYTEKKEIEVKNDVIRFDFNS